MVVGFIFYDVVRCWCLFPGTALWEWVLNSGLVEKLPSASCQEFSSLIDFFAAMFLVLLDVAMMWLASGWHVALARSVLLLMFVGLLAAFKVCKPGSEAAFSVCLLHAASGGLTHCGLCSFLIGATLMWLAPAGSLRFVFFGSFVAPIVIVFMGGSDAAFSARLLDAASRGLALGRSCPLMVGATLLWLAPAGFESVLLQEFYASGLWMCALLVAVPKTETVPVVLESSIEEDVADLMVAGSETATVPVVVESSSGGHECAVLVAASENESVPVVLESSFREDASLAGSETVSSSGGLCPGNCFSLKKEKGKVLVDQAPVRLVSLSGCQSWMWMMVTSRSLIASGRIGLPSSVACSRVSGNRLLDGWTSPTMASCQQQHARQQARNWKFLSL